MSLSPARKPSSSRWLRFATAGMAAAALGLCATSTAAAAPPKGKVHVPGNVDLAKIPGTTVFGTTPADTPETVSFVLTERHLPELTAGVENGQINDLSVSEFAERYGQTQANVDRLTSYLKGFGISTKVYADKVDVVATGTAGQFDKALAVTQQQYSVPAQHDAQGKQTVPAQKVHGTKQAPSLPADIAPYITAVLGLSNYSPYVSNADHVLPETTTAPTTSHPSYDSAGCLAAMGLPEACHLPSDFASNYGLDALYKKGHDGSGQTVGIITVAALDEGAPEYFWKNVAKTPDTGRTLTVKNVDGGPGAPGGGSNETDLDVEQSGAVAPGADVVVYQAPNTDPGFADAFFSAASENVADTVSVSWAESETYVQAAVASGTETAGYIPAFDEAALELAAQGQSTFVASGDWGAYTATIDIGTKNLSVATPSSSPFVTSAGGTTLPWSKTLAPGAEVNVPEQRAWGWDYLWKPVATAKGETEAQAAESMVSGTGGGFSAVEPQPTYQKDVSGTKDFNAVQYLTPTDYQTVMGITEPTAWDFTADPAVTHHKATGRAIPDVSADADPYTGYMIYSPVVGSTPSGGWGGTSFVAPQLNGAAAVINSAIGGRSGFWNPAAYKAAKHRTSPFTTMQKAGTSNDNLYYTGNPGAVFNPATGLGYPDLSALANVFAEKNKH